MTTSLHPTMWSTAVGRTFRRTTGFGITTSHGPLVSLYGQASIIWVNLHLIIPIGQATRLCSVSSIWLVCRRIDSISTAAIGTRKRKPYTSCHTGIGKVVKAKSLQYLFIPIIQVPNSLSTGRARASAPRT